MKRIVLVVVLGVFFVNNSFSQDKGTLAKIDEEIITDGVEYFEDGSVRVIVDVNRIKAYYSWASSPDTVSAYFAYENLNMESFDQFKNEYSSMNLASVKEKYRDKVKPWLKDLKANNNLASLNKVVSKLDARY
jgi:hypothetical protein